jgi:hypothetical protein
VTSGRWGAALGPARHRWLFADRKTSFPNQPFTSSFSPLAQTFTELAQREAAIARERLAPGGLLLVSYNAMPGWAHLQPIRGILLQYAALRMGDSAQRVRDALLKQDPRYLVHEYLNEHWTSFYFAEVAEAFGQAGLPFVGSLPG